MGSQTDLDQGGTFRQKQRVYMGPSVGWLDVPTTAILVITAGGTTVVAPGMNFVHVNVAATVNVQLPSAKSNLAGAQAVPGSFVISPVSVVDLGGNANGFPITITPAASETIDGLATLTIDNAFGGFTLYPKLTAGGWTITP